MIKHLRKKAEECLTELINLSIKNQVMFRNSIPILKPGKPNSQEYLDRLTPQHDTPIYNSSTVKKMVYELSPKTADVDFRGKNASIGELNKAYHHYSEHKIHQLDRSQAASHYITLIDHLHIETNILSI